MKITYDRTANVAYLQFRERQAGITTVKVAEEMNVDLAPDGSVYGVELLNAREQLGGVEPSSILVVDESSGKSERIKIAV